MSVKGAFIRKSYNSPRQPAHRIKIIKLFALRLFPFYLLAEHLFSLDENPLIHTYFINCKEPKRVYRPLDDFI